MNAIRLLLFLLVCSFQFNSCSDAQNTRDDLELSGLSELKEYGLKGKVKLIRQEEFLSDISGLQLGVRTGQNSFSYEFDADGIKINEQTYDSVGLIKTKSEYLFDVVELKKVKKVVKNLDGTILHKYEYFYNQEEQLNKVRVKDFVDRDVFEYYIEYTYDTEGNQIGLKSKMLDGTVFNSSEEVYRNGLKIKTTVMDNMGSPYAISKYEYNSHGDVIKEYYYIGNGQLFSEFSCKYSYDSKGNWIKKIYSLDKKSIITQDNVNDKEGVQTITLRTITYY